MMDGRPVAGRRSLGGGKMHVAREGHPVATCSASIHLDPDTIVVAASVKEDDRCVRRGCSLRWPDYRARPTTLSFGSMTAEQLHAEIEEEETEFLKEQFYELFKMPLE